MEKAMIVIESKGLKPEELSRLKRLIRNFRMVRRESGEAELSYLVAGDGKDYAITSFTNRRIKAGGEKEWKRK